MTRETLPKVFNHNVLVDNFRFANDTTMRFLDFKAYTIKIVTRNYNSLTKIYCI